MSPYYLIWAMFYAGLVHIQMHPRNDEIPDLDELALLADDMLMRFKERFPWPPPSQQ